MVPTSRPAVECGEVRITFIGRTNLGNMPVTRVNTPQQAPEGRFQYLQRVNGEHESIYVAIGNRDAEAARAAMRTHLSNSRERLRKQAAGGLEASAAR